MTERWVECTRDEDGERMWVNMAQAWLVSPWKTEKGKPVTRLFARAGVQGLTCETVREKPEHFLGVKRARSNLKVVEPEGNG